MPLLLLLLLSLAAGDDLLRLASAQPGAHLPPGWHQRGVRGRPAPRTRVVATPDGPALEIEGQGAAAWFYRRLERPDLPSLAWEWRVTTQPAGVDLGRPESDDSPLRLFVAFGELGRGRIIFYSWGGEGAAGLDQASFADRRWWVIRLEGAESAGDTWRQAAVRPAEDYRRIWGEAPPPVTAVGLFQDTDHTSQRAVAQVRRLMADPTLPPSAATPQR